MMKFCTSYNLYSQSSNLYELQLVQTACTNCNLYSLFVQVATCTKSQLVHNIRIIKAIGPSCLASSHESWHMISWLLHLWSLLQNQLMIICGNTDAGPVCLYILLFLYSWMVLTYETLVYVGKEVWQHLAGKEKVVKTFARHQCRYLKVMLKMKMMWRR